MVKTARNYLCLSRQAASERVTGETDANKRQVISHTLQSPLVCATKLAAFSRVSGLCLHHSHGADCCQQKTCLALRLVPPDCGSASTSARHISISNPTRILVYLHPLSKARCTVQCVIVFRKWDRLSSVTLRMLSQFNVGLFWYRGTTALVLPSCLVIALDYILICAAL